MEADLHLQFLDILLFRQTFLSKFSKQMEVSRTLQRVDVKLNFSDIFFCCFRPESIRINIQLSGATCSPYNAVRLFCLPSRTLVQLSLVHYLGTRSACINAATLALADAGIPMRDLVTSCSAGYLNSTPLLGKLILKFLVDFPVLYF